MTQVIKASGIEVSRNERNELLLRVNFRDLTAADPQIDPKYSWMPQWETVRYLIFSAIIVEAINHANSQELSDFDACISLCQKVRHNLTGLLCGQLGIED